MLLVNLLKDIKEINQLNLKEFNPLIKGISFNSKKIKKNFIFVAVNMSMVLGLLPIVGAPLPIMSYGGSSMLSIMMGLGVVMSCKVYKNEQDYS